MATETVEIYENGRLVGTRTVEIPPELVARRDQDDRLDQALAALRAYRDTASPTNAQTVTVVKVICRVLIVLIRQRRNLFDGSD